MTDGEKLQNDVTSVDEDHCYTARQCLKLKNRENELLKLQLQMGKGD